MIKKLIPPQPFCPLSSGDATKFCINPNCTLACSMCKQCKNNLCMNKHIHDKKIRFLKWSELLPMVQLYNSNQQQYKKDLIFDIKKKIQIIVKDIKNILQEYINQLQEICLRVCFRNEQNQNKNILKKIMQSKYSQITGKDMNQFYGFIQGSVLPKTQTKKKKEINLNIIKVIESLKSRIQKSFIYHIESIQTSQENLKIYQLNKKLQVDPRDSNFYYSRGIEYQKLNNLKQAEYNYIQSINFNPNHSNAYFKLARIYDDSNRIKQALQNYTNAINTNPLLQAAFVCRAIIYQKLNRVQQAQKDYTTALQINPKNQKVFLSRGLLYYNAKKYGEAIKDYSKAIGLNREYEQAYQNRGLVYKNENRLEYALEDYCKALSINGKNGYNYNSRGNIYYRLKKYEQAFQDFSRAIQLKPDNYKYYQNRALAARKLNKIKQAQADQISANILKS